MEKNNNSYITLVISRPQMLQTSCNNCINYNLCNSNLFSESNETNPLREKLNSFVCSYFPNLCKFTR
uniref:Uncharacterized protein n=1 Tax=Trichobilharzia regenti TaxID=157069 RepID=A0AA85JLM7_TRIRE|nr:unnamed protein product [Trichobilharzia regenti]